MDPLRYRIELDLDEAGLSFRGRVALEISAAQPSIRLDARDLEIASARVDGRPVEHRSHPETEELELPGIAPGPHRVEIAYSGSILSKGLTGLYRCPTEAGPIFASMCYPTGARRIFPCVDEPSAKAVFELTVTADTDSEFISNTPAVGASVTGGRRTVRFAPTPTMSTYLLFLAVGPFAFRRLEGDGTALAVAAPAGREGSGGFALEHAARALAAFEEYFAIRYPLPKLDLVDVPDFWAGAMENWGAIAFHETRILVDGSTSARVRRGVRSTVTHELAHQWFGNLVTNRWWNDFWLNEGFATFLQAKIDMKLYPELGVWNDFLLGSPGSAYEADGLRSTHPIAVEVEAPAELAQIADAITYGKGASVLAMIERYLGEGPFREGIRRYLGRFAYSNAESNDLWTSLEEATGQPVRRIMDAWIRLPGLPVVSARREGDRLVLAQRRYFNDGASEGGLWPVPLTLSIDGRPAQQLLDLPRIELPAPGDPVVQVNPGRSGFYRVLYEGDLLDRLLARFDELEDVDRWGLLLDGFSFALAGLAAPADHSRILAAAALRPTPLTGGEVAGEFLSWERLLARAPPWLEAHRGYFQRAMERIGLTGEEGESEEIGQLRGLLAQARLRVDGEFARELAARFEEIGSVPADLRLPVAAAYGLVGADGARERLVRGMFEAPSEDSARQMMAGLVHLRAADDRARVLAVALDPRMPTSRTWSMVGSLARVAGDDPLYWPWLRENLRELERRFAGTPLLGTILEAAIPFAGMDREAEVRGFFAEQSFPEADRGARMGLERLGIVLAFLRRNSGEGTDGEPRGSAGPGGSGAAG